MNVDPVSGNEVPVGSLPEEVRDDVDAKLSPGEFVIPADVVRFIGVERWMKMRDEAKKGIQRMAEIGQMGNADEVGEESNSTYEDDEFESEIDDILGEVETEQQMAEGGLVGEKTGQVTRAGRPVYKTKEGANVSELSITVPYKGVWANVPSIHNGKQYSEDEIQDMLNKGKIKPTSVHKSVKEAVDAAKKRSDSLLSEQTKMAFGGYVGSGTDLTKAPKNPVFDVRYYKNKEGATMFITHINGKPMTPVPEGFTQVSAEEAQKVGKAAEEEEAKKKKPTQDDYGYSDTPQLGRDLTPEEEKSRQETLAKINMGLTYLSPVGKIQALMDKLNPEAAAARIAKVDVETRTPGLPFNEQQSIASSAYSAAINAGVNEALASQAAARVISETAAGIDINTATNNAVVEAQARQDMIDRGGGGAESSVGSPSSDPDFGTGRDFGSRDLGENLAKGGLVAKRQYPTKKKKGKGIAASK